MASAISKLVLVIMSKETREVLERWQFEIEIEGKTEKENSGRWVRFFPRLVHTHFISSTPVKTTGSRSKVRTGHPRRDPSHPATNHSLGLLPPRALHCCNFQCARIHGQE